MGFPRYECYKPARSKWLSEVPSHWNLLPGMAVLKENKIRNIGMIEETVLSLSYGKVIVKPPEKLTGLVPESFETYQVINPNDIIIRPTDLQNDQTSLRTGISKDQGIITSAYICLRPDPAHNPTFIHYLLHAYDLLKVYYGMGSGLRQNLDFRDFKRLELCIPPRKEQDRIANFLDQKTAEVDEAIDKKQRLIELLKEQKAILINQAVTKGLNPNVPMRDSGVEWIGEVPAHWDGKRAKFLFTQSRLPVQKEDDVVTAFRDGQVTLRTNRRTEGFTVAILEQGYQGIRKGQLVLNSMDAFAGAIGVSDSDGKCSPEYVICDPIDRNEVDPMYYALLLREMALSGYIEVICSAVRQRAMRIRFSNLSPLLLPVPPLEEQLEIVKRVAEMKDEVDAVIGAIAREVDAIKDYREILISETVTGKIKI